MSQTVHRMRDTKPTTRIALGLSVIAALGLVASFTDPGLDAWTPNITVGALTIAATVTFVDHAIRREAQLRIQPRIQSTVRVIRAPLKWLLSDIANDFVGCRGQVEPFPSDALSLTEAWIDQEDASWEDSRPLPRDDAPPRTLVAASRLVSDLERIRSRDREILEPTEVDQIDEFVSLIERAAFLYEAVDAESRAEARSSLAILIRSIVYAAHNLVLVFGAQHPEINELDSSIVNGVKQTLDRPLEKRPRSYLAL